jgi:hypothetical protein
MLIIGCEYHPSVQQIAMDEKQWQDIVATLVSTFNGFCEELQVNAGQNCTFV